MNLRDIFATMKLDSYYVAEVVNGKEIRVTVNYSFKADAENALLRMGKGNYVVKTA